MTREEKLADTLWYYIKEYVRAWEGGLKASIRDETIRLDRQIQKALRSKAK